MAKALSKKMTTSSDLFYGLQKTKGSGALLHSILYCTTRWMQRLMGSFVGILIFAPNICNDDVYTVLHSKLSKIRHFNLLCELLVSRFACSTNMSVCLGGLGVLPTSSPLGTGPPQHSSEVLTSERMSQFAQWSSKTGNFQL